MTRRFGIKLESAGGQQNKGVVVNNRNRRQSFMKMPGLQAGLGFAIAKTRLDFNLETVSSRQNFIEQVLQFGATGLLAAGANNRGGMFTGACSVMSGVFVCQFTDSELAAPVTVSAAPGSSRTTA